MNKRTKLTILGGVVAVGLIASTMMVVNKRDVPNSTSPAETTVSHDQPLIQANKARTCTGYYALTFDDGPVPMTQEYLNALGALDAPATFFVNGYRIKDNPGYIEKMAAAGHQIGNHTEDHDSLTTMDEAAFNHQIDAVQAELAEVGVSTNLFRAPYGTTNPSIRQRTEQKGLLQAWWSVDTKDWEAPSTESIVNEAMATKDGDILLLHENKILTLPAIAQIIHRLETKGLCPGKIVKSDTELPTDRPDLTMNVKAVKP